MPLSPVDIAEYTGSLVFRSRLLECLSFTITAPLLRVKYTRSVRQSISYRFNCVNNDVYFSCGTESGQAICILGALDVGVITIESVGETGFPF